MNAVFEAEKAMGRMPKDVSAQRGLGYDIESMDDQGDLFFIEVKGRVDGADSVTLTINEVNTGRNSPHRFRLALVTVDGRSGRSAGVRERHRLGHAGLRRYPDHQEPAAAAGGWEEHPLSSPELQELGSRISIAHFTDLGGVELDYRIERPRRAQVQIRTQLAQPFLSGRVGRGNGDL